MTDENLQYFNEQQGLQYRFLTPIGKVLFEFPQSVFQRMVRLGYRLEDCFENFSQAEHQRVVQ